MFQVVEKRFGIEIGEDVDNIAAFVEDDGTGSDTIELADDGLQLY